MCRISIVTNATILSDRVKNILEKLNCDITVSIDSINSDNYARIRKNAILKNTQGNIEYLKNYTIRKNTNFNISACAMNLNANELVDLTDYANSLNCEVFFTRVTYPRELSLEILDYENLKNIVQKIRNSKLPRNNKIQDKNYKTLNDLANHLEFWNHNNKTSHNVKNIDQYFDLLHFFLKENYSDTHEILYENITMKINYLLEAARENNAYNLAESKICEVPFATMYEMVPSINKEHLLHLFKTFITPIEN